MLRLRRRRGEGGFTMIEIMVSLGLLVIGLMGILALHMATVKGNRASRQLERARVLAVQLMEDLRNNTVASLGDVGDHPYDTVTPVEGTTYTRSYSVGTVTGAADLVLITTRVTFPLDEGGSETSEAKLQMIRTRQESL
jgi:type IV pilus modification protein PilV